MKYLSIILLLVVLSILVNCEDDRYLSTPTQSTLDRLLSAPESIEVQDQYYSLFASLRLETVPGSVQDEDRLMIALWVREMDGNEIPNGLDIDELWVVKGDEIWSTNAFDGEPPYYSPDVVHRVVFGGPNWGPGISVQVVVGIEDSGRRVGLLRAPDQWIWRPD